MKTINFECSLDIAKAYEDDGRWIVEGLAATSDFDLQEDIITPSAIETSAKDLIENSTVLLNHNPEESIGKVEDSQAQPDGLWLKILVSKTVPDVWQKITEGVLNKFSIRGRILEARKQWIERLQRFARLIFKMQLVEVSLVAVPANPKAKALRWYIEKALDEFEHKGGQLEEIKGGTIMDKETGVIEEELIVGQGNVKSESGDKKFPEAGQLQDQWKSYCRETDLVKKTFGQFRQAWDDFCKQQGYPCPSPYPYPQNQGLIAMAMGQIMGLAAELLDGETDTDTIDLLGQIRDIAMAAACPYPDNQAKDDQVKPADDKARLKKSFGEDELVKKLGMLEETVKKITAALGVKEPDSKNTQTASIAETISGLVKRLEAIEGIPAVKTSIDGQEPLPGEKKGKIIWKGLI